MSTYAVGDIHGNSRALDDLLLHVLAEVTPDDTLVFLGDTSIAARIRAAA